VGTLYEYSRSFSSTFFGSEDLPTPLTPTFVARVQALKSTLDEVYPKSLEDWLKGFEHDWNPEPELLVWECMALAYRTFTEGAALSKEAKGEALDVTLQCSLGKTEEQILNSEHKVLHTVEVLALVDCYRAAAETTFAIEKERLNAPGAKIERRK